MKEFNNIEKWQVLYDSIIVEPIKDNEEVNGLILPTSYEEKTMLSRVVSIGNGRLFDDGTIVPLKVKVGDYLLFNKYSVTQLFLKGKELLILREEDVIAIYRD